MWINKRGSKNLKLDGRIEERLSDEKICELATRLLEKNYKKKRFGVKEILLLLATGVLNMYELTPRRFKYHLSPYMKDPESIVGREPWQKFNKTYLISQLTRLEKNKLVKSRRQGNKVEIVITRAGKVRVLRYALDALELKEPEKCDGYFRLVVYDLPERLRGFREYIWRTFKRLNFYQLQKSVYLHAYPCEELVEFLREFLGIGRYIKVFRVKFENPDEEKVFKKFFGIK